MNLLTLRLTHLLTQKVRFNRLNTGELSQLLTQLLIHRLTQDFLMD